MRRVSGIHSAASHDEVLDYLRSIGTEKHRDQMARMGVPVETAMGVPMSTLRKLAKDIGRNQELAVTLWDTRAHEARLLAALLAVPEEMTIAMVERWLGDVRSWDLCDHLCNNVFQYIPTIQGRIDHWAVSRLEFTRRAAFSTIACMVIHDPGSLNGSATHYLDLIRRGASDRSPYVRKAVSWALRELGKVDARQKQKASAVASELRRSDDANERWVGRDASAELETLVAVPERRRLLSSKSKVGSRGSRGAK